MVKMDTLNAVSQIVVVCKILATALNEDLMYLNFQTSVR
jgi:hypothetical protein